MSDDRLRDDITHIEERIETLRNAIERCRKLSLAARVALYGGAAVFLLAFLPWLSLGPNAFFGGLAAMLGGAVLLGSNATTWNETEATLAAAEQQRAQFIGAIGLRLVGEENQTLH